MGKWDNGEHPCQGSPSPGEVKVGPKAVRDEVKVQHPAAPATAEVEVEVEHQPAPPRARSLCDRLLATHRPALLAPRHRTRQTNHSQCPIGAKYR